MSLVEGVKELLFPACCLSCGKQLGRHRLPLLCELCSSTLSPIVSPLCPCCGVPYPSGQDHLCGDCLSSRVLFDLARASFLYKEPVASLILQWKFGHQMTGLATMAALSAGSGVICHLAAPDVVLPVPLHKRRLQERGFNQALQLARACFPDWKGKIVADGLQRLRATVPQVTLSGSIRRKNLKGAFSMKYPGLVHGKTVLLIDDVVTTGSTIHECCRVLRLDGAHRIEVFTLARSL